MKQPLKTALLLAALCALITPSVRAGTDTKEVSTPVPAETVDTPVAQEFTAESSYSSRMKMKQGSSSIGGVDDINNHFNYVVSPTIKDGLLLRFGADFERNSFGLPPAAPLPNTLQSANLIIGTDMSLSDKIIMRAEIHPGVYSDFVNVTSSDIDAPVQIGGTYLYSEKLQFILGIQIDLKSNYPIIGLPGIRWQFADHWVLSAIPPKPQIQYEVGNGLTLYTGAELNGGTYHLNDQFGTNHGHGPATSNSQLNGNIVDYTEVRVGAGVTWKFTPNLSLDVSGGYIPYRDFDLHQDKIGFDTHSTSFHNSLGDGAPYAEVGVSGSF